MTVLRMYLKTINKDRLNNLTIDMVKCGIIIKVRNQGQCPEREGPVQWYINSGDFRWKNT